MIVEMGRTAVLAEPIAKAPFIFGIRGAIKRWSYPLFSDYVDRRSLANLTVGLFAAFQGILITYQTSLRG